MQVSKSVGILGAQTLTSNSFKGKGKDGFSGRECNAEVINDYETTLGYLSMEETLAYLRDSTQKNQFCTINYRKCIFLYYAIQYICAAA